MIPLKTFDVYQGFFYEHIKEISEKMSSAEEMREKFVGGQDISRCVVAFNKHNIFVNFSQTPVCN